MFLCDFGHPSPRSRSRWRMAEVERITQGMRELSSELRHHGVDVVVGRIKLEDALGLEATLLSADRSNRSSCSGEVDVEAFLPFEDAGLRSISPMARHRTPDAQKHGARAPRRSGAYWSCRRRTDVRGWSAKWPLLSPVARRRSTRSSAWPLPALPLADPFPNSLHRTVRFI